MRVSTPGKSVRRSSVRRAPSRLVILFALVGAAHAQNPQSQPANTLSAEDLQRANEWIGLIEGNNAPEARQTGVRELLRLGWSETPKRLAAILSGNSAPAKVAVATVLSDSPAQLLPAYVEPLIAALGDPAAEVRRAVGGALAAYRDGGVVPRLRAVALDESKDRTLRLAAIETLGRMVRREAIGALIDALEQTENTLRDPALAALKQATGLSFGGDAPTALRWWTETRGLPSAEWQQLQIESLLRQLRDASQRLRTFQTRLKRALRDGYLRAPEAERTPLLQSYLADPFAEVRLVGLELVQSQRAEGKTLTPETVALAGRLLTDGVARVREAAVYTVANFRNDGDGDRFGQMLTRESDPRVRLALVNGLGYVGSSASVEPLLRLMEQSDERLTIEAVTALGRLVDRGVVDPAARPTVAAALLNRFRSANPERTAMRERVLAAMSRFADPQFGPVFAKALAPTEAVGVRQAAARGLAVLADPSHADALAGSINDPDGGVRKSVVETLAKLASSDAHLEALWTRLAAEAEADQSIRQTAWRGVLTLLTTRPAAVIEGRIARLPASDASAGAKTLELLKLAEAVLAELGDQRGELGRVRARIAAQHVALKQPPEAVAMYRAALADMHAAGSAEIPRVAMELLRFALVNDLYDSEVASLLANGNPALDSQAVWEEIRGEIERRVNQDDVDRAIAMLAALQARPPTSMPADVTQAMQTLLERARQIKEGRKPSPPSSQPASAATTQPNASSPSPP